MEIGRWLPSRRWLRAFLGAVLLWSGVQRSAAADPGPLVLEIESGQVLVTATGGARTLTRGRSTLNEGDGFTTSRAVDGRVLMASGPAGLVPLTRYRVVGGRLESARVASGWRPVAAVGADDVAAGSGPVRSVRAAGDPARALARGQARRRKGHESPVVTGAPTGEPDAGGRRGRREPPSFKIAGGSGGPDSTPRNGGWTPDGPDERVLVGVARSFEGVAFLKSASWPAGRVLDEPLSTGVGDLLRLETGARVSLELASGGSLWLRGPAFVEIVARGVAVRQGEGLVRAAGPLRLWVGPYLVNPGRHATAFQVDPFEVPGARSPEAGGATEYEKTSARVMIGALGGVVQITGAPAGPLALAPGRAVRLDGRFWQGQEKPDLERLDIAAVIGTFADFSADTENTRFPTPGQSRIQTDVAASEVKNDDKKKPSRTSEAGSGAGAEKEPQAKSTGKSPVLRVDDSETIIVLPLRDRLKALDSPASRYYSYKKRDALETAAELALVKKSLKDRDPDEVQSLRLHKLSRLAVDARGDLDTVRNRKESTYEHRLLVLQDLRDNNTRAQREDLFGAPLTLQTRRLRSVAQERRTTLLGQAQGVQTQIDALRLGGDPLGRTAGLEGERNDLLTRADLEADEVRELIRVSAEAYR